MTADIELLPLPEALFETGSRRDLFNVAQMQGYARANVAHATEPLKAEIEALRAEVAAVWNAMPSGTRYLDPPDGGDVPLHEQVRRMAADAAHAERLAEALRELLIDMMLAQSAMRRAAKTDPRWEGCAEAIQPRVDAAHTALRDHDQEVGE